MRDRESTQLLRWIRFGGVCTARIHTHARTHTHNRTHTHTCERELVRVREVDARADGLDDLAHIVAVIDEHRALRVVHEDDLQGSVLLLVLEEVLWCACVARECVRVRTA